MGVSRGPSPIVTDGLVFCMDAGNTRSYTSGSSTCTDMVFNAEGTIDNTITFNSSNGGYWIFDGTDSDIALGQGGTGGMWSTNPCTYEFVLTYAGADCVLWMDRAAYNGTEGVEIWMSGADSSVTLYARGSSSTSINSGDILSSNTWYHIIVRYDGTTGTLFVNGSQVATGTIATVANTTYNTSWGKYASTNTYEWGGNIALGRIYHKAFTQAEVTQNYNSLKGRFGL